MSRQLDSAVEMAYARLRAGDLAAAETILADVLRKAPRTVGALHLLAAIHVERGNAAAAVSLLQKAVRLRPADAQLLAALGNALSALERWPDARAAFRRAAAAEPRNAEAGFNLAVTFEREALYEDAARAYRDLLDRFPDYHDAWVNLGIAYEHLGRVDDAIPCYRRALDIVPGSAHAYANLGNALRFAKRLDEARAACLEALRLDPRFVDAHVNLAAVLVEQGNADEARAHYEAALAIEPDAQDVRLALGVLDLALGRFDSGWEGYASRPTRRRAGTRVDTALPRSFDSSDVLVLGEQGLGDEVFFLRYAALLAGCGARVHVECDARIVPMVERTGVFASVLEPGGASPRVECTVAAGDLPQLLARAGITDLPPPFALRAVPDRVERIRESLHRLGQGPYIGLTWRAGTPPDQQRGRVDRALFKAAPLETLAEALHGVEGTFLALQRQALPGEAGRLSSLIGRDVHDFTAANEDLEEMLALLEVLDEYVGVSNTNMHLRAGLGRMARALVPNPPEWRWMWRGASPWFPGFCVHRETPGGGWMAAAHDLAAGLGLRRE